MDYSWKLGVIMWPAKGVISVGFVKVAKAQVLMHYGPKSAKK